MSTVQTAWGRVAGSLATWLQTGRMTDIRGNGAPEPLADGQARNPPFGHLIPFGTFQSGPVARNDWGAAGTTYTGGKTTVNPIGAGIVVRHRVSTLSGPVTGVQLGTAVIFNNQMQNYGIQPGNLPLYTPQEIAALLGPVVSQSVVPGASQAFINSPGG